MAHPLPIRWRLTAWYAALLTIALVVFGAVIYVGLSAQLSEALDDQVRGQSDLMAGAILVRGGQPTLNISQVGDLDNDQFVRLWALDGRLVSDTTGNLDVSPPSADLNASVDQGHSRWTTQQAGSEPLRILSVPVREADTVVGMLQVGLSRGDIEETLSRLVVVLVVSSPILLGGAVWGGYLLAARALGPVAAITRMAGSLSGSAFDARLNLDLPDDELGRLARTFDAMLARIDDAFGRQRRFTGDAAHELRTPLSLMRSRVDLALTRPRSNEEYQETLRGLDRDLIRLNGLVGTLLTLARADSGQLEVERVPFDLADTIAGVLEQYATSAERSGIDLLDQTSPSPLEADEDLCIQLLVNLIDNALAHTTAGDTVSVGCRRAGNKVMLWVTDTGSGIAPEHHERVFDRFYRVDDGRDRASGGTGLGLGICRAIAEAHGGTIGLASRPAGGTRVDVRLRAAA
jgi:two-component system OmpR family sensor kinase